MQKDKIKLFRDTKKIFIEAYIESKFDHMTEGETEEAIKSFRSILRMIDGLRDDKRFTKLFSELGRFTEI